MDYELIAKHFTGEIEPLPLAEADVNGDGEINSLDINAAYQEFYYVQGRKKDSLALVAIYKSLNGPLWNNKTNWCSDKPIDEWYGVDVYCNRVCRLILQDNNLTGSVPAEIGDLQNLEDLALDRNSIKSINPNIGKLKKLSLLELSDNPIHNLPECIGELTSLYALAIRNICTSPEDILPSSLGNLKNLRALYIEHNYLTTIPSWIFELTSLEELDARDNKISSIPHDILNLTNLKWLLLDFNEITGTVPDFLAELEELSLLSVKMNKMDGVVPIELQNHKNWENFKDNMNPQENGHLFLTQEEYDYAHNDEAKKEERDALIAIYNALGGDNWVRNDNWCSDKPMSEWYGVYVDEFGHVVHLDFNYYVPSSSPGWNDVLGNNLNGHIPAEISKLSYLVSFQITNAPNLTGSLPDEFYDMKNLQWFEFYKCGLEGTLSPKIRQLKNLTSISIEGSKIGGEIPAELFSLPKLKSIGLMCSEFTRLPDTVSDYSPCYGINLSWNKITGSIPDWVFSYPELTSLGLHGNKFEGNIPKSIANAKIATQIDLSNNSLTGNIPDEVFELENLNSLGLYNNQLDGILSDKISNLKNIHQFNISENNFTGNLPIAIKDLTDCNELVVYGNRMSGSIPAEILNCDQWKYVWGDYAPEFILKQQDGYGLTIDSTLIVGPDMTHDGEVKQLQQHTKGKGFSIVFMGDGYLDSEGEKYDNDMQQAYDAYFAIEPLKSLKEYFDVYTVRTVSQTLIYRDLGNGMILNGDGNTALHSISGHVGDASKCMEYLLKAIPDYDGADHKAQIVVIQNVPHSNSGITEMYPDGFSIAYCDIADSPSKFIPVLQHEACGHGFGLLGDEYYYDVNVSMPEEYKAEVDYYMSCGFYKNIDFTNDLSNIKWNTFVSDDHYSSENIGAYEGGLEYTTGVYRPTYNSIMRNHWEGDGFNAPSREAIYKRMMEYSYGSDWIYSYDDFVAFDNVLSSNAKRIKKKNDNEMPTAERLPKPIMRNYPSKLIKENTLRSKILSTVKEERSVKYQIGNVTYERKGNKVRIVK